MDEAKVESVVIEVLEHIQKSTDSECPELSGSTKPLSMLKGFDSPTSAFATSMVAKKLEITIPDDLNIFGDEDAAYSIEQTVSLVCKITDKMKKKKEPEEE